MNWFLAIIIILLPAYMVRFSVAGLPTTLLEILIYLAVLGALISQPWAELGRKLKQLKSYGWPILLFILCAAVSTFIAPDKRLALGILKAYIVDPILLFGVIVVLADRPQKRRALLAALLAAGLVSALPALALYNNEGRAVGLYLFDQNASPNYLALFLAPLAGLGYGLAITAQKSAWPIRPWAIAIGGLITIAVGLTQSRGALFGLAAAGLGALAAGLYADRPRLKRPKFKLLLAFILTPLVVGGLTLGLTLAKPNFTDSAKERQTTSNNLRYEIWRTTIVDIIPASPLLGTGLGNYQNYFTEITAHRVNFPEFIAPWARTPHNFFLTIWTNLGLFGLIAIIWIIIVFYHGLAGAPASGTQLGLALAMLALLVHGLVDSAYWKNDLAALFWVIIALGYLEASNEQTA